MRSPEAGPLAVDAEELVACVACGLCLPHCPTYRVTGREIASPRGRIAAMRAVQSGAAPLDAVFRTAMEECVQCRACEAACPSSVPFGHLMEGARETLHTEGGSGLVPWAVAWFAYRVVLPRRWALRALSWVLVGLQTLRLVPRRFRVPGLSVRGLRLALAPHRTTAAVDAYFFAGCVMDAWLRDIHVDAVRVMEATGATVGLVDGRQAACCGALHVHAGRIDEARALAARVVAAVPGGAPVVVDSAGCSAAMKDYGRLLGTDEGAAFAARVRDWSEWVAATGPPSMAARGETIVVQDPCHLRHVQRQTAPVRAVLGAAYDLAETADDGLCCGAGGAYAVLQPSLSTAIRDRKVAALRAAGGSDAVVASANPGCIVQLRAAGIDARHPATLAAAALHSQERGT